MSKKVLYISNCNDRTGWSNAAMMNILALDSAGVRVVPRSITYKGITKSDNPRIAELEQDDLSNIDVCIQHTLPTLYTYNSAFKNIGMYETETESFSYTMWHKFINLMDEAWVPNRQALNASKFSNVKCKIRVAPHCIDYSKYENIQLSAGVTELEPTFNFCFVGEMTARKNLSDLLKAFHLTFHPSENVNLFLKISTSGDDDQTTLAKYEQMHNFIKNGLKIRTKYKEPVVISGFLEEQHLYSVMKQCHCFVCPSHGEGWCIPALEAMALGLPVIYPEDSGLQDFAAGYRFKTYTAPCFGAIDAIDEAYSSFDAWQSVDLESLCHTMRLAYNTHRNNPHEWSSKAKLRAETYDYKNVGQALKELI